MQDEKVDLAYARLGALKANLPDGSSAEEKFVQEFHQILELLEQVSGVSLGSFWIPREELKPLVVSWNTRTGKVQYGDTLECDRAYLMMKIDGLLKFFEIQMSGQKTAIGFSAR